MAIVAVRGEYSKIGSLVVKPLVVEQGPILMVQDRFKETDPVVFKWNSNSRGIVLEIATDPEITNVIQTVKASGGTLSVKLAVGSYFYRAYWLSPNIGG